MKKLIFLSILAIFLTGCEPEEFQSEGFRGEPCLSKKRCIDGFECSKDVCIDIPVTFNDEVFKKCLEEDYAFAFPGEEINAYNLSLITRYGCAGVKGEDGEMRYIENISDIRYFKNLKELSIYTINHVNTYPLSSLYKLERLHWGGYGLYNLDSIENLSNLQYLYLENNRINNLNGLKRLKNLTYLWLVKNYIVDVSPIAYLDKIKYVNLSNNCIVDYSPIQDLIDSNSVDIFLVNQIPSVCNNNLTWDEYLDN